MMKSHKDFSPHFFVVGAPKAGTTAVYHWLQSHPAVFLPSVKEPSYFAYAGSSAIPKNGPYDPDYVRQITVDRESYAGLYDAAGPRLTGDISPIYLLDEYAAERIAVARPDARIIILLRDPVERAFSQFKHHVRDSLEACETFEEAIEQEEERLRGGWSAGHGYATHGQYLSQIEKYFAVFSKEQILVLEYQDLQSAPEHCWLRICEHLHIKPIGLARNERVNATRDLVDVPGRPGLARRLKHPGPAQALLKRLIPPLLRAKFRRFLEGPRRPVPVLRADTARSLAVRYQSERSQIERLTGLSLTHWTS
ncbi:sulfotransferase family protein [Sulfitobacter sp.]|uniref:sulfotransferase family protein n=1 Tax=Sulfitobacter sp. TaxID=1903071 RepID=UPI003EF85726